MKIYDCFTFFNELDLLEIRLHQHDPIVDYFVLVEGSETFTARPKPFFFEESKDRFSRFANKIIHIKTGNYNCQTFMGREEYQRNHILQGLGACDPEDVILISDVDELFRPEAVQTFIDRYSRAKRPRDPWRYFAPFQQPMYMYHVNAFKTSRWNGTVACRYVFMEQTTPHQLRLSRRHGALIRSAGWHFAWLGGPEKVAEKTRSDSHSDKHNNPDLNNIPRLTEVILKGLSYDMGIPAMAWVPVDDSFPKYLVDNQDRFSHLIWRKPKYG